VTTIYRVNFARAPDLRCNCTDDLGQVVLGEVSVDTSTPDVLQLHYGCGRCGVYWREDVRTNERETDA
jgi:hypothetical protein